MAHHERSPEDPESEGGSPSLIGPFLSPDPYGAGFVIPGPWTAGPPRPEPEERWTLAPGHKTADVDDEPLGTAPPAGWLGRLRRLFRRHTGERG